MCDTLAELFLALTKFSEFWLVGIKFSDYAKSSVNALLKEYQVNIYN